MKRTLRIIIPFVLASLGIATWQASHPALQQVTPLGSSSPAPSGFVVVTRVVDGDTIVIEGDRKVRLIGVNTPETVDPRRPVQCFGHEASNFTKSLLEGHAVKLEKDISETDKYGRLLRYVYSDDGTFVNLALVQGGYAQVNTYPPDVAHTKEFQAAQADAKAAKRGLWGSCPVK